MKGKGKYKLKKKHSKLQGHFTVGKTYQVEYYAEHTLLILDDNNRQLIINSNKENFNDFFVSVNKERKEKLEKIEKTKKTKNV